MLRAKRPDKLELAHDHARIHSLMIYTDMIENNIVGDTTVLLRRCFLFISKLKAGNINTTGQHLNNQKFSILQFKPLFEIFSNGILIDLKNTRSEKISLYM